MTDVHTKIHEIKSKQVRDVTSTKPQPFDPIKPVAEIITADSWLICFDEFQVMLIWGLPTGLTSPKLIS